MPVLQIYGARPIRRWLEKKVVTELSKMLLREEIDENSTVYIDAAVGGKGLSYLVDRNGGLVDEATRKRAEILIPIPGQGMKSTDAAHHAVKKMKIEENDDDEM